MSCLFLQGTDTERSVARGRTRPRLRRLIVIRDRRRCNVRRDVIQETRRRHEKQATGDGTAEIQQPVVIARRLADEHILQHLLDPIRRARITDEVSAELALPDLAERHVVAHDLKLLPVLLDRGQNVVGIGLLLGIELLDVGQLVPADDVLLLLDGQRIPALHVMQILLDDDVAAASEGAIFIADDGGINGGLIHRIFRAVDKAEQVAIVEITEAMDLVRHRNRAVEPRHDLRRQLKAQIHAGGPDMQHDVARRRDRMMNAMDFTKGMQAFRSRRAE
jgi:hypothetical protein